MTTNAPNGEVDVLVIGSGAAGMTAALTAAVHGLKVRVIEKSHVLGGTSAMSGAGTWVPANHHARAAGVEDSAEEAWQYLRNSLPAEWRNKDDARWRAMAYAAAPMLDLVEQNTRLEFALTKEPDPMMQAPGAKSYGRMLSPKILSRGVAGPFARRLRPSTLPHFMTYQEMYDPAPYIHPFKTVWKLWPQILYRLLTNSGGQGSALMAGLIGGCLDKGVEILPDAPAQSLLTDEKTGDVIGAVYLHDGVPTRCLARRGVLLSSGGFEWDSALFQEYFPGPTDWITSPRSNSGDGLKMAQAVGAMIERLDQANIHPALPTRYEGRAHGLPVAFHSAPHAIIVDRTGKRFISEYDYNLGHALDERAEDGSMARLPAWLIADRRFMTRSLPFLWYVTRARGWVRHAGSIPALAGKIGLPAETLARTVARFNGFCASGRDEDFRRGEDDWERFRCGWTSGGINPSLGAIETGPFFAIPMNRSTLGTKGGPMTDADGQVLRRDGTVLRGLYCAGNAMANPIGTRSVAAGTTIGPHMTWGYICARHMAGNAPEGQPA